jgi:glycosyltransferase involved in cell wall biosynthesis
MTDVLLPRIPPAGKATVLHIIPSLRQGGAERILSTVVTRTSDLYRHHIVTLLDGEPFFDIADAGMTVLGMNRARMDFAAIGRLKRTVGLLRPELIHAWMYHANLLTVPLAGDRIPILWSIHNTGLSKAKSRRRTRWINRVCAGLSQLVPDLIVYCSRSARDAHETIGYARRKTRVIENGVDVTSLFPDSGLRRMCRRELGIADSQFVICSLARFDPQKGHMLLLDAVARARSAVSGVRLLLIGTGCEPHNRVLADALQQRGLSECTLLLGARHDVNRLLNAADLLVMCSTFGEALPLAILEAAAVGLPVVASAVGSIEELNLADTIISTPEPARFADAICAMAAKPYPRAAASAKRRLVEKDLSAGRMLSSYDAVYRELLSGKPMPVSRGSTGTGDIKCANER